jgi:hypothetical protein
MFVAERERTAAELAGQLAGLDARTPLLLQADEGTGFRYFVLLIDLSNTKQLNNVSIVTWRWSRA